MWSMPDFASAASAICAASGVPRSNSSTADASTTITARRVQHEAPQLDRHARLPAPSPQALETVNADLLRISRLFLNEKGLPERPWFKNQIYAPGAYTGYSAKPIAAVREYMDEKKWREAEGQVPQVAQVIENVAAGIDKAAADFENQIPNKR